MVIIMKLIIVIILYVLTFRYINVDLYEGYIIPWFCLDIMHLYFSSFFVVCFNIFLFKKNKRFLFYSMLFLNNLFFVVNDLGMALLILYVLLLIASYFTNVSYQENKKAGYISLIYLCYVGYMLVSNQLIILLN